MSLEFSLKLPRRSFTLNLSGNFENDITAVFGPSGSGKTTLLNLIAGLISPETGTVRLNGRLLTDTAAKLNISPDKRGIGFVFQEKLLFPHMSVRQNLGFGLRYLNKRAPGSCNLNIETAATLLDLNRVLDSKPSRISGGEQQRTAIGRALLSAPELLLLDEPFNAVDNVLRDSILMYLKRLRHELNIPMIIVSHELSDIRKLTNTVQFIKDGKSAGYGNINDYERSINDTNTYI